MQILGAARVCFLGALLVAGIIAGGIPAAGQSNQSGEQIVLPEPLQPARPSSSGDQIFADLVRHNEIRNAGLREYSAVRTYAVSDLNGKVRAKETRSEEHTSELQSRLHLVCRLLLEKKKKKQRTDDHVRQHT